MKKLLFLLFPSEGERKILFWLIFVFNIMTLSFVIPMILFIGPNIQSLVVAYAFACASAFVFMLIIKIYREEMKISQFDLIIAFISCFPFLYIWIQIEDSFLSYILFSIYIIVNPILFTKFIKILIVILQNASAGLK